MKILIVEDEVVIRSELRRLLTRRGYEVAEAGSVTEAIRDHRLDTFDLILADLRLPGGLGTDLLEHCGEVPLVVMTSYATVRSAVDAIKMGAIDYVAKPFDHDELLAALDRATLARGADGRRAKKASRGAAREVSTLDMIIGTSGAVVELKRQIRKVAPSDATVLVLGESGTGKELVARALHEESRRRAGPYVPVNCASIPETLIESELFGHERGAFTGAASAHTGLVEAAEGGTLFLDEVGELPASAQARLLRTLQSGEIRRIGSTKARRVDVRLVAATHRDLPAMVREGTFRSDLWYRLRVFELKLPPLRVRGDDVILIAEDVLARACERAGRAPVRLSKATEEALRRHAWPGNVRELANAIERALILCEGSVLGPELLSLESLESHEPAEEVPESAPGGASLEDYFRRFVLENQANLGEAELAKRLGISRKALWERRQRMRIPKPK